ncbi:MULTISPECIES: NADP-dependent oxidoreductase [unclassified Undibacterium]|uniref:NADP-dependent oxidoreductase n=1 Tax=unclassified Undibacterium TaxID=2630295 RepID=UPI002AC8E5CA|nr:MULTISPECIES: NADP-dependent oxidoreductase [unclassified Undibacterium]MEB0140124.1 NADP-dependent oxidoreductase [Undibacterium sp. CCC2.1]MEB0173899.1 NADP-dependent oxidoreductase [Undibacterium sp. CCC1.1]MEB0178229.1 NADP-dependent oxidoreductase [Undibacterium sp. CCC3.4]MEB0214461.1 NADP-dependent oxidoreductase [Undibacterium sp. 5I2]WPX42858.1 NADP-dependent oxidoreductase [Undibacterium sp. CCC3.4]
MTPSSNQQYRLAARPVGMPKTSDWSFVTDALPELKEGDILVQTIYLSLDPAMRGWMNEGKSYIRPVAIGEVMRAGGVGKIIASKSDRFAIGDYVSGGTGVQQYWSGPANDKTAAFYKIDRSLAPLPKYLNALGMPGMTAYFGLLDVGQPKAGETVVVSGAAGAVGQTVGQVAKQHGCRVVGIAGGKDKCDFVVNELGFDACIDYKTGSLRDGLKEFCPNGVDIYFDNVGGDILDTVLTRINLKARIIICGAISQYNNTTAVKGPANYLSLLVNRARMEGIVVFDYAARYAEAVTVMGQWMAAGQFQTREDIVDGLENFPATLLMLFEGKNFGKLILQVSGE